MLTDDQEAHIAHLLAEAAEADATIRPVRYEAVYAALREMNADFRRKLAVARLWFDSYDPADDESQSPVFWLAAHEVGVWLSSSEQHEELANFCRAALARNVMTDEAGFQGNVRWLLADAIIQGDGDAVELTNEYLVVLRPALDEIADPLGRGHANFEFAKHSLDPRRLATITDSAARSAIFAEAKRCLEVAKEDFRKMEVEHGYFACLERELEIRILQNDVDAPSDIDEQLATLQMAAEVNASKEIHRRAQLVTARVRAAQGRIDEAFESFALVERPAKRNKLQALAIESRVYRANVLDEVGRHDDATAARSGIRGLLTFYKLPQLEPLLPARGTE